MIEEHPAALTYDWRTRFGLPLASILDSRLSWHEAWLLLGQLLSDPTSHTFAAVAGWRYPWSHEAKVLADLYDLTQAANTEKKKRSRIKPYPRPWKHRRGTRSRKPTVDQATIRAALIARGH